MIGRLAIAIATWTTLLPALGAAQEAAPLVEVGQRVIDETALDAWLSRRFPEVDPADHPIPLRSAALLGLVRRHLALQTLRDAGGASLTARIERHHDQALAQLRRADPEAVLSDEEAEAIAWEVAWGEYLQRHLTETNLERYYEAHRWRFDGTRILVSQIFLPGSESEDDVRRRAAEWAASIGDGEMSFAEAARRHSLAPSAADGGRIGWVTASGDLPPAVTEAAFAAEPRSVVGPIRSSLGWHLLWVEQRESGATPFEEFADHAALRRSAADFLFARLVRTAAAKTEVRWISENLKPPPGVDLVP